MLPKSLRISANVEGAAAFRILSVRLFHYVHVLQPPPGAFPPKTCVPAILGHLSSD